MPLNKQYWNERYQSGETGWDMGRVSPPLKHYIDQITDKDTAVFIPGAGNSHEALYLLQSGFTDITIVDIAPIAVERLREKTKDNVDRIKIIEQDFLEHEGKYDLILEQTFFCALDPSLRKDYAKQMHHILNTKGKLVGVLFNKEFIGGPPFGGNEKEYEALLAPYFHFHTWELCYNSYPPRAGSEWFMNLGKK